MQSKFGVQQALSSDFADLQPRPQEPGVVWVQGVGCVQIGLKDLAALDSPMLSGFELVERTEPRETRWEWWMVGVVTKARETGISSAG